MSLPSSSGVGDGVGGDGDGGGGLRLASARAHAVASLDSPRRRRDQRRRQLDNALYSLLPYSPVHNKVPKLLSTLYNCRRKLAHVYFISKKITTTNDIMLPFLHFIYYINLYCYSVLIIYPVLILTIYSEVHKFWKFYF